MVELNEKLKVHYCLTKFVSVFNSELQKVLVVRTVAEK